MASPESSASPLLGEKKDDVPQPAPSVPTRKPSWSRMRFGVLLLIVTGIALVSRLNHGNIHYDYRKPDFGHRSPSVAPDGWTEWSTITPSEKLVWQPCFQVFGNGLQCARLTVPMDYHRPLNGSASNPKVHIALVMKPGLKRTKDPASYSESPLIINPGGPGGSGAFFAISAGPLLQTAIGPDRDIIGFDPRGIGATTPKADCFVAADDPFGVDGRNIAYMNRMGWAASGHEIGLVNSSNVALSKLNARSKALTKLCKRVDEAGGDNSIFRYTNTPNVARDMLSIVDAWDEWRSTSSGVKPAKSMQDPDIVDELQTVPKLEPEDSTRGKLVYWGFSYGTLLGATFASMFPDKVGRLILDGVVDADHYVNPVWGDNIHDTDPIWDNFFVHCAEAGPRCQFYRLGYKAEDIKKLFNDIMERLKKEPAIVLPQHGNVPILITASDFKQIIFSSLYAPITSFPGVAILLKALADGELDKLVDAPSPGLLCHNLSLPVWPDDSSRVVACNDKRYKLNEDLDGLQKQFENMSANSSFADVWMGIGFNLPCNGWDIETKDPPMRWDDHPIHKPTPIDTSFPILFLSNTRDPVTPLRAAHKMTRKFSKASIVENKAEGHCTISCVSLCLINHVRAYLDKGILPPEPKYDSNDSGEWTTCPCDEKPWKSLSDMVLHPGPDGRPYLELENEDVLVGKTAEEAEIMKAYSNLRWQFVKSAMWHQQFEYHNPLQQAVLSSTLFNTKQPTCTKP